MIINRAFEVVYAWLLMSMGCVNECMRGLGSVGMVPVDSEGSSPDTTVSVLFDSPFASCCCFSQVMTFET